MNWQRNFAWIQYVLLIIGPQARQQHQLHPGKREQNQVYMSLVTPQGGQNPRVEGWDN